MSKLLHGYLQDSFGNAIAISRCLQIKWGFHLFPIEPNVFSVWSKSISHGLAVDWVEDEDLHE